MTRIIPTKYKSAHHPFLQQELEDHLMDVRGKVHEFTELTKRSLDEIDGGLREVFDAADQATSNADYASKSIDQVYGELNAMSRDITELHIKVDALLAHYRISDPVLAKKREAIVLQLWSKFVNKESATSIKAWFFIEHPRATMEQFDELLKEAELFAEKKYPLQKRKTKRKRT
jgi:hypothetical protein